MKKTLLQFLLFLLGGSTFAQQTGSFNTQVFFNGQNRTLACYVPPAYDSTASYRLMIGLHGLGDNSNNYRNALINTLAWHNTYPNTIFIFPDGGTDPNRDFYAPAGDEGIIAEAMSYAMQHYWIDSNYVVLQGFSLGGRSAAKYGLDNPTLFKGLLLNTPAFQGWQDAHNQGAASLMYNYSAASQIPIYITVGDADLYYYMLETLVPELKKMDAIVNYNPIANLGHTIPGMIYTAPAYPFFENPGKDGLDLDVFDIEMPQRTCNTSVSPKCFIQNRSDSVITSLNINYQFGAASGSQSWTGMLLPYEHAEITLSALSAVAGSNTLDVSLGNINGMYADTLVSNNSFSDSIQVELQGMALPLNEGFEGNSPNWVFTETGTIFEWYRDTDVKKSGSASVGNFNTILMFNTEGNVESFESPLLDLTTATNPLLSFDIAFNYHRYTPPYLAIDTSFADTLEVQISTDCGQSWQSLYKKGGADLATAASPITNALNLNQVMFNPTSSQWRRDSIALNSYGNAGSAILKFNYISALGGSINIDNISVGDNTVSLEEDQLVVVNAYPNPVTDVLHLSWSAASFQTLELYNISGEKVMTMSLENGSNEVVVSADNLSKGIYIYRLHGDNEPVSGRFIKK